MIVKNMRWSYHGRGYGYGAEEGVYLVETVVTHSITQQNYFILCMRDAKGCKLYLSEAPMIDVVTYAPAGPAFEKEVRKLNRIAFRKFKFQRILHGPWYADDDDVLPIPRLYPCRGMYDDLFDNPIRLTLAGMERCWDQREPRDEDGRRFIYDVIEEDVTKLDLGY